jgi:hypothetical protein
MDTYTATTIETIIRSAQNALEVMKTSESANYKVGYAEGALQAILAAATSTLEN